MAIGKLSYEQYCGGEVAIGKLSCEQYSCVFVAISKLSYEQYSGIDVAIGKQPNQTVTAQRFQNLLIYALNIIFLWEC